MTPEERLAKIEDLLNSLTEGQARHDTEIDRQAQEIRALVVTSNTSLSSVQPASDEQQEAGRGEVSEALSLPDSTTPAKAPSAPIGDENESRSAPLLMLWNLVLARRVTFVIVFLAVIAIGIAWFYKQVPVYRASVSLEIDQYVNRALTYKQSATPMVPVEYDDEFATQYKVLSSETLAREVVVDLHLDKELSRTVSQRSGVQESVTEPLRALFSQPNNTSGTVQIADPDPLRPYIDAYLGGLSVKPVPKTRLVTVSYESADPQLAAKIANSHVEHFIEQNLQTRLNDARVAAEFLSEELEKQKSNLETAEAKLQAYSVTHQLFVVEDRKGDEPKNTETERLSDLEAAYTKAQTDRIERESAARLATASGGNSSTDVPAEPGSLRSQLLDLQRQDAALAARFQPGFGPRKEIQNQIQTLSKQIESDKTERIKGGQNEYVAALDREKAFAQELERQGEKVNEMKREDVQYDILKRDVDSNQQLYDTLLLKLKETGVESSLKASNVRIVDRAQVPQSPIRPDKTRTELFTFFLAIVAAVGAVKFQDYVDSSVKSQDDVTNYLKLPTLGVIPRLTEAGLSAGPAGYLNFYLAKARASKSDPAKASSIDLISHSAPASLSSEAYRSLRASLILSSPDRPPRTILVTSSVPSEGKTSTAANLAISLTQSGARVLLIDGDMRRPRIHLVFSVQNKAGLANYLTGTEELENVIHETAVADLSVIPCGVVPPNPGELILSNRFKTMLQILPQRFDYIVLDSPPVSNVSDSRVLAVDADGVVFVVRALSTSRHVVVRSLEQLEKAHSRILGVVLNDYDLQNKGSYYYPYYKSVYYKAAYSPGAEIQKDQG